MKGYLGEEEVPLAETPWADFTPPMWALLFITKFGTADGAHHKHEALTAVAKILCGVPVVVKLARWDNGFQEYRFACGADTSLFVEWKTSAGWDEELDR